MHGSGMDQENLYITKPSTYDHYEVLRESPYRETKVIQVRSQDQAATPLYSKITDNESEFMSLYNRRQHPLSDTTKFTSIG